MNILQEYLDTATAKSEYKKIQFFIIALLLGLLIMAVNFFAVKNTTSFFKNENTKFLVICWFVVFIFYELFILIKAKQFIRSNNPPKTALKLLHVATESFFPTLLIFGLCYIEESDIFLDSPLVFFYFILIGISALNLESKIGLTVGIISSGGYLLVTIWAINRFDASHEILHFPPILYIARSFFMMIASLGSIFVAYEIKKRTLSSFELMQQKNEVEHLFGQQVSEEVMNTLLNKQQDSIKHEATIFFLDIRNFSSYAETIKPEEVIIYQNNVFGPILHIIHDFKGITNQLMGDGLMATFGAPIFDEDHSENALKAGLAILEKIKELSDNGIVVKTRLGIGINTGSVVMGNIGNELRKQFSVSGTAVIIAARLEQANKEFKTQLIISDNTLKCINQKNYHINNLGIVKVKNIEKEISIYEVNSIHNDDS